MSKLNVDSFRGMEVSLCVRCKTFPADVTVRSDRLCRDCFMRYVATKVVKRMEGFRVRYVVSGKPRRLLLPISFGVSSTVLLQLLDQHLQSQMKRVGRTGFELVLLHVEMPLADKKRPHLRQLEELKHRFQDYEILTAPLDDIFNYTTAMNDFYKDADLKYDGQVDVSSNRHKLDCILSSTSSATSQTDVLYNLLTRLILEIGKKENCEGILFGDSTTRLAEKILAETAKGRGFGLTWRTADGVSPNGISLYFPLRDVLRKELVTYASFATPSLDQIISPRPSLSDVSASSKTTSIDDLMSQYFESVEVGYPSIVANVVRTTAKLRTPQLQTDRRCKLCNVPLDSIPLPDVPQGQYAIGDIMANAPEDISGTMCYGCARTMEVS